MSEMWVRPEALDMHAWLGRGSGDLAKKMDIQFHSLSATHATASMPVEGNTQSYDILHGGAFVVLGESMGSICANVHAHENNLGQAVGIEINASHTGSAISGFVWAECTAIHLGRTLTTHEIVLSNAETGKRLSTVRITNLIKDLKK